MEISTVCFRPREARGRQGAYSLIETASSNVRYTAHVGLRSHIAPSPRRANRVASHCEKNVASVRHWTVADRTGTDFSGGAGLPTVCYTRTPNIRCDWGLGNLLGTTTMRIAMRCRVGR